MPIVLVALGGAAGAVSRYLVDSWISSRVASAFPWGTLVVNVSGSFLVGVLFALAVERGVLPSAVRAPVMIGFLGAYTTFSTLVLESWWLHADGATGTAILNLAGSIVVGILAVVAGLAIGRAIG